MTRDEWLALAERCEKATGPDRELDFAIDAALAAPTRIRGFQALHPYTASLDAITALIEREFGADLVVAFLAVVAERFRGKPSSVRLLILAICAAFCRAMAEKGERG